MPCDTLVNGLPQDGEGGCGERGLVAGDNPQEF